MCFFLLIGVGKANAAVEFTVDGFRYAVIDAEDETVALTSGVLVDSALTVPASVNYEDITYSVISIKLSTTRTFRSQLKTVVLPEGITSIGEKTFSGCSSLTNIKLPASLDSIGYSAFYNCTSLSKVTVLNPTPVSIYKTNAFSSNPASATLYVPSAEAVTDYSNSNWVNYFTIDVLTGTDKLNADKASDDGAFYDLNGRKMMSKPVRGLYLRNGKKYMNAVR